MLDHFVLTRFNPRIGNKLADDGWMTRRFPLFERVTVPSMQGQRCKWLVFFDEATTQKWRKRIDALDGFEPVFLPEEFSKEVAAETVARRRTADVVITTRMDNDDGLSPGFTCRVQRVADRGFRGCVDFPAGIQRAGNKTLLRVTRGSAFLSMIEDGETLATVYSVDHWDPPHPTKRLMGVGWEQTIHEDNLANRVRGVRIPRSLAAVALRHQPWR